MLREGLVPEPEPHAAIQRGTVKENASASAVPRRCSGLRRAMTRQSVIASARIRVVQAARETEPCALLITSTSATHTCWR